MKPHKHAALIKAWADGATIQYKDGRAWWSTENPEWWKNSGELRIKPEPKPEVVKYFACRANNENLYKVSHLSNANLVLIYDGETGKLKRAEVL